ncbi:MAG: CPBP family glutamic-type intramembrane protease [Tenacibaculum sp.]|nr:CPBP family glutamic-type intramembrane protease [Tenacibaculum sp.]
MKLCNKCKEEVNLQDNFCKYCGSPINKKSNEQNRAVLNSIIGFYTIIICYIGFSSLIYSTYPESLFADIGVELVFIGIVLVFCAYNFNEIISLYKSPKLDSSVYFKFLPLTILFSYLIYFGIGGLNELLFFEDSINIIYQYTYTEYPFLWSIVFVAIIPPIFEELAFRGYLFNQLSKIISIELTIIATAFLFALVHLSFISIIWIFPFGLFLGYLRKKYDTLWIPMLIHFVHNSIVLMLDYYYYNKELTEIL